MGIGLLATWLGVMLLVIALGGVQEVRTKYPEFGPWLVNRLRVSARPRRRRSAYARYHARHAARLRYKQHVRRQDAKTRRTPRPVRDTARYDTAQLDILLAWKDQQRRPSRDEMLVLLGIGPHTLNKMLDSHRAAKQRAARLPDPAREQRQLAAYRARETQRLGMAPIDLDAPAA